MVSFEDEDLRGAVFRESDLRGVRMRGVLLNDADLDGVIDGLMINGVEVAPLIEAELDRRHPERVVLRARTPEQFRVGWAGLQRMWAATDDRVLAMPPGTVDVSVDQEWSYAETLRHLIFVTDTWLGWTVQGRRDAYHPIGMPLSEQRSAAAGYGIDPDADPSFDEVREVRADRIGRVTAFLADLAEDDLGRHCPPPPFNPGLQPTVRSCLGVLMNEEWEHHRFAVRDLNAIDNRGAD